MQFGFMPGKGTTDAIFILRQKKNIYLPFVNLEKAFDYIPHRILWWTMWKLTIDEWII